MQARASDLLTHYFFACGTRRSARALFASKTPVWVYVTPAFQKFPSVVLRLRVCASASVYEIVLYASASAVH